MLVNDEFSYFAFHQQTLEDIADRIRRGDIHPSDLDSRYLTEDDLDIIDSLVYG